MATYNITPPGGEEKTPGTSFKWLVRISGLIAIAGFFLPYLNWFSGLDYTLKLADLFQTQGVADATTMIFAAKSTMGSLVNLIVFLGYYLFPVIGLLMLLRGKYSGGPFTLLLLFNIVAAVMVSFFGADAGIEFSFFGLARIGYWVSCAGIFIPFVGMFFLDKSI